MCGPRQLRPAERNLSVGELEFDWENPAPTVTGDLEWHRKIGFDLAGPVESCSNSRLEGCKKSQLEPDMACCNLFPCHCELVWTLLSVRMIREMHTMTEIGRAHV